jgi:hypothetical protein
VAGVKRVDVIAVHVHAVYIGQKMLVIGIYIDGSVNLEVIVDGENLGALLLDCDYDV